MSYAGWQLRYNTMGRTFCNNGRDNYFRRVQLTRTSTTIPHPWHADVTHSSTLASTALISNMRKEKPNQISWESKTVSHDITVYRALTSLSSRWLKSIHFSIFLGYHASSMTLSIGTHDSRESGNKKSWSLLATPIIIESVWMWICSAVIMKRSDNFLISFVMDYNVDCDPYIWSETNNDGIHC